MNKVSIVLPVYNGEKYIKQAIESVLKQTYYNWELIIVDDCSTDHTGAIISKYVESDTRIKVIRNDENKKLPKSLNIGFANATGNYYTWTSDDNIFRDNAIERMVEYLNKHEEIGMVYSDYTVINEDSNEKERIVGYSPEYLVVDNVVGACFMYRKNVADVVGKYDESAFLVEDYDYWIRVYLSFGIAKITEDLYLYRHHGSSLSSTRLADVIKMTQKTQCKYFNELYPIIKNEKVLFLYIRFIRQNESLREKVPIIEFVKEHPKYLLFAVKGQAGNAMRKCREWINK